jgi:hypothetical protein
MIEAVVSLRLTWLSNPVRQGATAGVVRPSELAIDAAPLARGTRGVEVPNESLRVTAAWIIRQPRE